jgi:hypothetical protein
MKGMANVVRTVRASWAKYGMTPSEAVVSWNITGTGTKTIGGYFSQGSMSKWRNTTWWIPARGLGRLEKELEIRTEILILPLPEVSGKCYDLLNDGDWTGIAVGE